MAIYNLYTLLHRSFTWYQTLPDGSIQSGAAVREIPVRIPMIQRDYAEGRETESVRRKRLNLLHDMLDVVYGIRQNLTFDFVYGYTMGNGQVISGTSWQNKGTYPNVAFEPLDGQQRLTTLFLFYWLFGREDDLRDSQNNHSLFIYETRATSEEFCHWLVSQSAKELITNWESEVSAINKLNVANKGKWNTEQDAKGVIDPIVNRLRFPLATVPSLLKYIQALDSFKWDWHDDPNICSMITVLESTIKCIKERGLKYQDGINSNKNLDSISFVLLDNLICDGDQLFEKMNARGKALTSFEILKSALEEEMEQQGLPSSNHTLTNAWRSAIDGHWIDYCWDNSAIGTNPTLETIHNVETKLERLLVRLAGKSFFTATISGTKLNNNADAKDYAALFYEAVSGKEDNKYVDEVIDRYIEYVRHERAVKNVKFAQLDLQSIYDDMENLICQVSTDWLDASSMLPQLNRHNKSTLLDEFMRDKPTHNTRVMIYAMLAYLRIAPAKTLSTNSVEKDNFVDWMRFISNVYNSDNKNSGLDNFTDVQSAIKAIDKWLQEYTANYRTNNSQDILRLIRNYVKANANGQEQARLDEEYIKADLIINGSNGVAGSAWKKSILQAENNYYLWGQIIAPLSWSHKGNVYDKGQFDTYVDCLDKMFPNTIHDGEPIDALLIQRMLCFQDYRHNKRNDLGSLGRLNNNRDYSWKQYLRKDDPSTGHYGNLFKCIIDRWQLPANKNLSFEDFLKQDLKSSKGKFSINDWQYYIVNIDNPQTILNIFSFVRTSSRYIYTESGGHSFYFKSDTQRTQNRYELLTTYLYHEQRLWGKGVKATGLAHTSESDGAHVDFTMPSGDTVRLSLGDKNLYNISVQSSGANAMALSNQNIDASQVEKELQKLGVITSL